MAPAEGYRSAYCEKTKTRRRGGGGYRFRKIRKQLNQPEIIIKNNLKPVLILFAALIPVLSCFLGKYRGKENSNII